MTVAGKFKTPAGISLVFSDRLGVQIFIQNHQIKMSNQSVKFRRSQELAIIQLPTCSASLWPLPSNLGHCHLGKGEIGLGENIEWVKFRVRGESAQVRRNHTENRMAASFPVHGFGRIRKPSGGGGGGHRGSC